MHPREVDAHFAHGKVKNWFGGSTNASTPLLDGMHYRGLLRIAGRQSGVRKYAPLPERTLGQLSGHLRGGTPQWPREREATLKRGRTRLPSANVEGIKWYRAEGESPLSKRHLFEDAVRLLVPLSSRLSRCTAGYERAATSGPS